MIFLEVIGDEPGNKVTSRHETPKKEDKTLQIWLDKFSASWDYARDNYHSRWERNYKLYRNRNVHEPYGSIETFVPMVNSTVNTIVAALFGTNPSIRYVPNHPDQEAATEVLSELYDDFSRRDGWEQKNKTNGRQGIITGNYCSFYSWRDDAMGGYVHKETVPIRDMILDPTVTSYEDWRYAGRRYFTDMRALRGEKKYDPETGKLVNRYKDLDKVGTGSGGEQDSDKDVKDQLLGSLAPKSKDSVEIIEIWSRRTVVVIANRSQIIELCDNPYFAIERARYEQRKLEHAINRSVQLAAGVDIGEFSEVFDEKNAGLIPFAHGKDHEDVSLVYGDSDVDNLADQQTLLNILTELNIEAILYQLYPEKTIDPKFSTWVDDISPGVGKVYPLPKGAMTWSTPPVIPQNAFQERTNIKDEMRETAAVSQTTKGVAASYGTTATEIKAMIGQADLRIQEKAQSMANSFFFQEASIVLRLIQINATGEMWLRSVSDAGVKFTSVDPSRFLGEYTPMVKMGIQKKIERAEEQEAAMRAFEIMVKDPSNNLAALKRIMYKKMTDLSDDEIGQIISAEPTSGLNGPPAKEVQAGGSPQLPTMGAPAPILTPSAMEVTA
jgi:hypothetical protein